MYIVVDDPNAHAARAKEQGDEIVMELFGASYGGQVYGCRDLEAHTWSVRTNYPGGRSTVGS